MQHDRLDWHFFCVWYVVWDCSPPPLLAGCDVCVQPRRDGSRAAHRTEQGQTCATELNRGRWVLHRSGTLTLTPPPPSPHLGAQQAHSGPPLLHRHRHGNDGLHFKPQEAQAAHVAAEGVLVQPLDALRIQHAVLAGRQHHVLGCKGWAGGGEEWNNRAQGWVTRMQCHSNTMSTAEAGMK